MEFVIIIALLLCNGLFAMYEIALVSSSKVRIRNLAEQGKRNAACVRKQMDAPEQTLSTIQIGITLIGIVSGAFGGMTLAADVEPLLARVPGLAGYAGKLSVVVTIALITYLSLVVGELVPKSIALGKPERYALRLAPLIQVLTWACYPLVWLLSVSTRLVNGLLGIKASGERPMTQEELKLILRQGSEQGVIDAHETEMLRDVFRFSDKRVHELMTPRHEMVVMHVTDGRQEVMETIRKHNYSKYVLVGGTRDDVRGIVSVKDIVLMMSRRAAFDLQSVVRPPLFLPETLYAKKAVELFKKNKTKFAVVVNEYGGTEGLVTLHDLTESIFGDILEENEDGRTGHGEAGGRLFPGGRRDESGRLHGGNGRGGPLRHRRRRIHHDGRAGHVPHGPPASGRGHVRLPEHALRGGGHGRGKGGQAPGHDGSGGGKRRRKRLGTT